MTRLPSRKLRHKHEPRLRLKLKKGSDNELLKVKKLTKRRRKRKKKGGGSSNKRRKRGNVKNMRGKSR